MIVVDASALYEVLTAGRVAPAVRGRLHVEPDQCAPAFVDAEVMSVLRRDVLRGVLDDTAGALAVEDLRDWPGDRIPHQPFLNRVWELRSRVRSWDAFYVALAEAMECPLLTLDRRLARVRGLECSIEVLQ